MRKNLRAFFVTLLHRGRGWETLFVAILALLTSHIASAHPVTWTLQDFVFSYGGTASGSFTYDADTNTYLSVAIVTTAGTRFGGTTYDLIRANAGAPSIFYATPNAPVFLGQPLLGVNWVEPLTDAGGTAHVALLDEGPCANIDGDGVRCGGYQLY